MKSPAPPTLRFAWHDQLPGHREVWRACVKAAKAPPDFGLQMSGKAGKGGRTGEEGRKHGCQGQYIRIGN